MTIFKKHTNKYKKTDDLWSALVKLNAGNACERCGKKKGLNSHHIFSRAIMSIRWDEQNGVCLCASCHTLSSKFSAHLTPTEFTRWIIDKRGDRWYDILLLRKNQIGRQDESLTQTYLTSIITERKRNENIF